MEHEDSRMAQRSRCVPPWLERSSGGQQSKKYRQSLVGQPRTVIYVMSPKELEVAAMTALEREPVMDQHNKTAEQVNVASVNLNSDAMCASERQPTQDMS